MLSSSSEGSLLLKKYFILVVPFAYGIICCCFRFFALFLDHYNPLSDTMSRMAPPRRSNDGRPISPIPPSRHEESRTRSSSENTPKTLPSLPADPFAPVRRPNKPSLSSSSSAGLGPSSENGYAATPNTQHLGVSARSGSRNEMYPASGTREAAASPVPSICMPF